MTGQTQYGQYCGFHSERSNLDGRPCLGSCAQRETIHQTSERELRLLRDRQSALEFEHLKYRLSQAEQVNHHLNITTTMLFSDHLARPQFNAASTIYGMQPLIPRQIPMNVLGNPVQPVFYPTLQTQPNLQYMNHMIPVLPPMTVFLCTSSQVEGIPTYPANLYTTRPVQLRDIPPLDSLISSAEGAQDGVATFTSLVGARD